MEHVAHTEVGWVGGASQEFGTWAVGEVLEAPEDVALIMVVKWYNIVTKGQLAVWSG